MYHASINPPQMCLKIKIRAYRYFVSVPADCFRAVWYALFQSRLHCMPCFVRYRYTHTYAGIAAFYGLAMHVQSCGHSLLFIGKQNPVRICAALDKTKNRGLYARGSFYSVLFCSVPADNIIAHFFGIVNPITSHDRPCKMSA